MAGRPTYEPARGYDRSNMGGTKRLLPTRQISAKDQRGQTKLKERQPGQNTKSELKQRDFKKELEEKERKHLESRGKSQYIYYN